MNYHNIAFSQLLKLIPRHGFEKLAKTASLLGVLPEKHQGGHSLSPSQAVIG